MIPPQAPANALATGLKRGMLQERRHPRAAATPPGPTIGVRTEVGATQDRTRPQPILKRIAPAAFAALLLAGCGAARQGVPTDVRASVRFFGELANGIRIYRVSVRQRDSDGQTVRMDVADVETPDGAPRIQVRDLGSEHVPFLLMQYRAGPTAPGLMIYGYQAGRWQRQVKTAGDIRLVTLRGQKAPTVLVTSCCPPTGWGYLWDGSKGYLPLEPSDVISTFAQAGLPTTGLTPVAPPVVLSDD